MPQGLIKKSFALASGACLFESDTLRGGTGEIRAWITVVRAILEQLLELADSSQ